MPDLQAEKDLAQRLTTRRQLEDGSRAPGKYFNSKIVRKILDLASQGYPLSEMAKLSRLSHFPSVRTINRWRKEDPEFGEAYEEATNDCVDDRARSVLPLVEKMTGVLDLERVKKVAATMPKVKGLEGTAMVNAIDKQLQREIQAAAVMAGAMNDRAGRTLQVAAARDPTRWGGKRDESGGVVIYDVELSDIKTSALPGAESGQGPSALAAMRPEQRDKILAALRPEERAAALKVLADLGSKPKALPTLPREE